MIGTTLSHYRITAKLGEGGMGEVYRAHDERLDRDVAIKVLRKESAGDPERLRRFEQEARAASALNHPNIVHIYDIGEHESMPYIAMELVEGETLKALLAKGAFPTDKLLRLAAQIAEGLTKAHAAGIVHRDLKPENLMVTGDGYVKILDFGLAKLRPQLVEDESQVATETRDGTVLGTVGYMSPEQASGQPADYRSDQFSLGSILYEMTSGKRLFRKDTAVQTLTAIIEDTPPPLRELKPELPGQLCVIVDRCLAKSPEDRYDSTRDLARDLRSLSEGAMLRLEVSPKKAIDSLVVLPLVDLRPEPGEEYFAEGMTETLITGLAKIGALKVISRTSAMHYKGTDKTPPQIAEELNVDAVVEGSVLRAGDRVRITAQLIDAKTDQHLWADSYDRDLGDVLSLQSEVARAIAERIQVTLTPQEQDHLKRARPVDPEAHDAYLKGRFYWTLSTAEGHAKSIELFNEAIERAPSFGLAYSGLADAYCLYSFVGPLPPKDLLPKAKAAALRALEIDDAHGEAHAALSWVMAVYEWDWPGAERECRRAIELSPGSSSVYMWSSSVLVLMGHYEEAIALAKRAVDLDPLWVFGRWNVGRILFTVGRIDEAIDLLEETAALAPDHPYPPLVLGNIYSLKGLYEEAIAKMKLAADAFGPEDRRARAYLGSVYAAAGRRDEALAIVEELEQASSQRWVSPVAVASIFANLGKTEETFSWLEKAFQQRDGDLAHCIIVPMSDPIRSDPRYKDLMRRINLLQYE
jgi:serine/threonine protein kinase